MTTRDNALAETTIGLYQNECIQTDSPFRRGKFNNLSDVEYLTPDYVAYTTSSASCTASAEYHPPKPRPATVPNA